MEREEILRDAQFSERTRHALIRTNNITNQNSSYCSVFCDNLLYITPETLVLEPVKPEAGQKGVARAKVGAKVGAAMADAARWIDAALCCVAHHQGSPHPDLSILECAAVLA